MPSRHKSERIGKVTMYSSDSEGEIFDNEADLEGFNGPTLGLFSDQIFQTLEECLSDAKTHHGFDLKKFVAKHKMDCFNYVKFVNFIRSQKPKAKALEGQSPESWSSDEFLKPVLPDDPLLMVDVDDLNGVAASDDDMPELTQSSENVTHNLKVEVNGDQVTLAKTDFEELMKQLQIMKHQISNSESEMQRCMEDMQRMKLLTQQVLEEPDKKRHDEILSVSEFRKESEDQYYASSYAHFGIHLEMLSDKIRTESYRDAIFKNQVSTFKGKEVLDLGCGTSILSMFSAKAGAKTVVGVDMSSIIVQATDIVMENGLDGVIKLVRGRLEDVKLPVKQFDVIVSEWMGYFLLFEGMLDSVIEARNKYLKPGGKVLPDQCTMHLCAVSDHDRYRANVGFWQDVYGFKMSCMKKPVLVEASIEVVPADRVVSMPVLIHNLDLNSCTVPDTEFETNFTLEISQDCQVTAIAGYFDTFFRLPEEEVMFTTGPHGEPTHWKQTVFYLEQPREASAGDNLQGVIAVKRLQRDARGLEVTLILEGKKQVYLLE